MRRFGLPAAVAALFVSFAGSAHAGFQAYFATLPGATGNNASLTGPIGLDFDVGAAAVRVTHLGAFDSFQEPPTNPAAGFAGNVIRVAIYDRSTGLIVGPTASLTGNTDPLVDGHRVQDVADFVLPAGFQGSVVAVGYNSTESAFDSTVATIAIWGFGTNTGGGLISFGGGRYGDVSPAGFPNTPTGGPANRYGAGTFVFEAADGVQAVPAPASILLFGMGTAGGLLLRRRKAGE
jgi:hypothetical protein